jgi:hypothetical protein
MYPSCFRHRLLRSFLTNELSIYLRALDNVRHLAVFVPIHLLSLTDRADSLSLCVQSDAQEAQAAAPCLEFQARPATYKAFWNALTGMMLAHIRAT